MQVLPVDLAALLERGHLRRRQRARKALQNAAALARKACFIRPSPLSRAEPSECPREYSPTPASAGSTARDSTIRFRAEVQWGGGWACGRAAANGRGGHSAVRDQAARSAPPPAKLLVRARSRAAARPTTAGWRICGVWATRPSHGVRRLDLSGLSGPHGDPRHKPKRSACAGTEVRLGTACWRGAARRGVAWNAPEEVEAKTIARDCTQRGAQCIGVHARRIEPESRKPPQHVLYADGVGSICVSR